MAVYAIGDIQGCFATFQALLKRVAFAPDRDRLWLVGDLVNRGPRSLDVLRWAHAHRDNLVCVLGNHDLNLLAVAHGVRSPRAADTLDDVLRAPDRGALLDWLVCRPLFHREGDVALVHAGLWPAWTLDEAGDNARWAEARLQADPHTVLRMQFDHPPVPRLEPGLKPSRRLHALLDVYTRLRVLTPSGAMDWTYSGRPGESLDGRVPWFQAPHRRGSAWVYFGHWSALGYRRSPGVVALDTGCVWGRALTAVRVEDGRVFQEPAQEG